MIREHTDTPRRAPLYETVAFKIADMVERGTFNPGDRVPSIRQLSRQLRVSINTVKTAYGYLEDRRVIESRPQSGYYVCARLPEPPGEPEIRKSDAAQFNPSAISAGELAMRIMDDVMDAGRIQFGAAIPDPQLIPAEKLNRMLSSESRRFREESTGYAMPPGNPRLRTQIARWMIRAGCALRPDDIIVTTGAAEAVFLALRALCSPGDTIAIGTPIYFNILQLIQSLGLRVLEIPSSPTDGVSIEILEMALEKVPIRACLVISNFNNPLGNCMPDDRKRQLLALLERRGVPLIEDDINGDLSFSERRPSVIKSWDVSGRVMLCSSFSKTLAPGYRVGWIAPGRYFEAVKRQKLVTSIAAATPTQLAVAEFLTSGGYAHHLRSIRKIYSTKTIQMAEAVGRHFPPGTRVTRPSGGFTLWVELPTEVDSLALYGLAEKQGITIAPGRIFSTTDTFNHCIRLNAALWSDRTRWAVEALGRMVHQLTDDKPGPASTD